MPLAGHASCRSVHLGLPSCAGLACTFGTPKGPSGYWPCGSSCKPACVVPTAQGSIAGPCQRYTLADLSLHPYGPEPVRRWCHAGQPTARSPGQCVPSALSHAKSSRAAWIQLPSCRSTAHSSAGAARHMDMRRLNLAQRACVPKSGIPVRMCTAGAATL